MLTVLNKEWPAFRCSLGSDLDRHLFSSSDILKKHSVKKTRNVKSIVPANLLMGIAGKLNSTWDQTKLHRQIEHKQHGFDGDTVLHVAIRCKLSLPLMREILSTGIDYVFNDGARFCKVLMPF